MALDGEQGSVLTAGGRCNCAYCALRALQFAMQCKVQFHALRLLQQAGKQVCRHTTPVPLFLRRCAGAVGASWPGWSAAGATGCGAVGAIWCSGRSCGTYSCCLHLGIWGALLVLNRLLHGQGAELQEEVVRQTQRAPRWVPVTAGT